MTHNEADIVEWRKNWTLTRGRDFTVGEVLTELGIAINMVLRSLGVDEIQVPRKGKITVLGILNLIPEENYDNVIGQLPPRCHTGPTTLSLVNRTQNPTQNVTDPNPNPYPNPNLEVEPVKAVLESCSSRRCKCNPTLTNLNPNLIGQQGGKEERPSRKRSWERRSQDQECRGGIWLHRNTCTTNYIPLNELP